ncbi:transmembrane protein, putative [Medicago truncatula]|uniref:Transmembrane protein, putative n=1 Tax=Medicago truncatula TaxID=3880 RepID=G7JP40_MEDTR|nr:transmembrane protein, putative [Medicago truncatula]
MSCSVSCMRLCQGIIGKSELFSMIVPTFVQFNSNFLTLLFESCKNLVTIHSSIRFLNKLKFLSAEGCFKLWYFPPLELISFAKLKISRCKSLQNFPKILENLSDECLPIILKVFADVTYLYLSGNNFKILPECFNFKECCFVWSLRLNECNNCMRPEKETKFCFPSSKTEMIPKWFEHQSKQPTISFWYRNDFPSIALFFSTSLPSLSTLVGIHMFKKENNMKHIKFTDPYRKRNF